MNLRLDLLAPELVLGLALLALFVQTLQSRKTTGRGGGTGIIEGGWLAYVAVAAAVASAATLGLSGFMFYGAYQVDALSQFFKLAVSVGLAIATHNASVGSTPELARDKRSDYYLFLALSAFGLMLLASSVELITIIISLEISSFSLYAIVPLRAEKPESAEAGIKYIMFGAVATALALFGLAYILAAHQTTYITALAGRDFGFAGAPLAALGLILFAVGFFYKLALFPFHFWAPDVYDGASNETAAYIATLPKLGAVVVLVRLAALLGPDQEVASVLAVLGALSMTLGNLMALAQKDIKRLLGFSSVAHAGYIMLGLVAGSTEGLAAAAFYALVYLVMNLTIFWVVCRTSPSGRNLVLDDLTGMHRRAPILAFVLAVAAFALVGLPPTAGFTGKLFLLSAAWGRGFDWLVVVAAVNTAISIFYYLNLVRYAYTAEPDASAEAKGGVAQFASPTTWANVFGLVLAAMVLALGVLPSPLFNLAAAAGQQLVP